MEWNGASLFIPISFRSPIGTGILRGIRSGRGLRGWAGEKAKKGVMLFLVTIDRRQT
jgi:hypothetical protein